MLENLEDIVSNAPMDEEEYVAYLVNNWLTNQEEEFYEIGYYDLGDFYLALERQVNNVILKIKRGLTPLFIFLKLLNIINHCIT